MIGYTIHQNRPFGVVIEATSENFDIRDLEIDLLKKYFQEHQIIVLRGFSTFSDSEKFADYCAQWGEVALWPFGRVLELKEQENPQDHIFDSSYVPMHWDGMFRSHIPEYQIFHCVIPPVDELSGRTTFCNTILALSNMSESEKTQLEQVTGIYHRKMEFYHSRITSPIIVNHPYRDYKVLRYNEPHDESLGKFINPSNIEFAGDNQEQLNSLNQQMRDLLYNEKNFYAHTWQKGDVVITDNLSLLHGRESFASKSQRHIQRVQVQSAVPIVNTDLETFK